MTPIFIVSARTPLTIFACWRPPRRSRGFPTHWLDTAFNFAPTWELQPQSQNLFFQGKRPSRLASSPGTMTALFQRPQVQRLIALEPTIEGLATDAKVTAGMGHLATAPIEIHPGQSHPRFPAQLHPGLRQSPRTGRFPSANLHSDTLFECH
jgi:hypothetical protein